VEIAIQKTLKDLGLGREGGREGGKEGRNEKMKENDMNI